MFYETITCDHDLYVALFILYIRTYQHESSH